MLNEDQVRYMTELAIFEKNKGREMFSINRYFKGDYISGQLFRSFFAYTFSYLLVMLLWVLYRLEDLLGAISFEELTALGKKWGFWYLAGLAAYLLITRTVYARRYDYASRVQIMYSAKLKHLVKRYDRQEKGTHKGGKTV